MNRQADEGESAKGARGSNPPALKAQIVRAFSSAEAYDDHAVVQLRVARRVADEIAALELPRAAEILEVGCGTGHLGHALGARLPQMSWYATDISAAMIGRARKRLAGDPRFSFGVVDAEAPPASLGNRGFDLICSTFAAQWFADLPWVLARLAERLRPGGHMRITTLAEGTFSEWASAHFTASVAAAGQAFPSLERLSSARPAGMAGTVELERHQQTFPNGLAFLRALKAIGAQTPSDNRRPLSAGEMRKVLRNFEAGGAKISYVVATCRFQRSRGAA